MSANSKTTKPVVKGAAKKQANKSSSAVVTKAADAAAKLNAREDRAKNAVKRRRELAQMELSKQLGARLKELRIACGLSQEQLGGEAELTRTAIGAIETGTANPTIYTLSAICHALKISLATLVEPITADMNLKPTWLEPSALRRRANGAKPVRKDTATARGLH